MMRRETREEEREQRKKKGRSNASSSNVICVRPGRRGEEKKNETKRKGLRFSVASDEMNDRSFFSSRAYRSCRAAYFMLSVLAFDECLSIGSFFFSQTKWGVFPFHMEKAR